MNGTAFPATDSFCGEDNPTRPAICNMSLTEAVILIIFICILLYISWRLFIRVVAGLRLALPTVYFCRSLHYHGQSQVKVIHQNLIWPLCLVGVFGVGSFFWCKHTSGVEEEPWSTLICVVNTYVWPYIISLLASLTALAVICGNPEVESKAELPSPAVEAIRSLTTAVENLTDKMETMETKIDVLIERVQPPPNSPPRTSGLVSVTVSSQFHSPSSELDRRLSPADTPDDKAVAEDEASGGLS